MAMIARRRRVSVFFMVFWLSLWIGKCAAEGGAGFVFNGVVSFFPACSLGAAERFWILDSGFWNWAAAPSSTTWTASPPELSEELSSGFDDGLAAACLEGLAGVAGAFDGFAAFVVADDADDVAGGAFPHARGRADEGDFEVSVLAVVVDGEGEAAVAFGELAEGVGVGDVGGVDLVAHRGPPFG